MSPTAHASGPTPEGSDAAVDVPAISRPYPYLTGYRPLVRLASDRAVRSRFNPGLEPSEIERAEHLLATAPGISLHDHPIRLPDPLTAATWDTWRSGRREELGHDGLRASGLGAVFFSAHPYDTAMDIWTWIGRTRADLAHQPGLRIAETATDVTTARNPGPAVFLALETLDAFDDDIDALELLYGGGIRMAGLAYDNGNRLGGGLAQQTDEGLTRRGRDYVALLNALGVAIDLSHAGDRTTLDVIELSSVPVVISHAGARSIWPIPRLKPDTVLHALADASGLIGISASPTSTRSREHPEHTIDSVMDHVRYLIDTIGVGHIGFGPDSFFGDHVGLHRLHDGTDKPYAPYVPTEPVPPPPGIAFVDGLENPRENFHHIAQALVRLDLPDDDIQALLGRNALRVLDAVFA